MSEPQKQPEKKPFLQTKKFAVLVLSLFIVIIVFTYLMSSLPNESDSKTTQQSPPNVIPATVDIPMSKESFDRCVKLTIDMVKAFPYDDNKSVEDTKDIDIADLRAEWKLLSCPSVENLITETSDWINRNVSP